MNNQVVENHKLYVSRAQKKKERQQELMRKHEAEKMERYNRCACVAALVQCMIMLVQLDSRESTSM